MEKANEKGELLPVEGTNMDEKEPESTENDTENEEIVPEDTKKDGGADGEENPY